MEITLCTKKDFDHIRTDIADFWGNDRTLMLHHPIFLYEFGNSAYVIKEGDVVIAYLFGFISQTEPVGYIQLVGVRKTHQRRGLGRRLYDRFVEFARSKGCAELRSITSPTNKVSIAFHKSYGMELQGTSDERGIPVVKNYGGPGIDRVVFRKKI